ncbi:slipin family protein [Actinospica durhamensis]|uniref:Slipin family protein n=1 Tax=Actinospica durhamensis TaxID=1508375 RepID=A0A941IQE6_9ACTN|nr:slipin family protein [Actinospica durhamensis]MBR7837570.1 slipin family protein [Actinospica durhamensis]
MVGLDIALAIVILGGLIGRPRFRIVRQFERGVVFRWGRVLGRPREAGIAVLRPFSDKLVRVNTQIITAPVPAQEGITRDNVTVRVDAVVYYRVMDPVKALIEVQDFTFAMIQVAQTSLRSIIGKSELDDLLANREQLNQGLALLLESPAVGWGIHIDRVEIKDVALPESMKRTMARQAEADRERRARIITADGELQASKKLAQAADVMADSPAALQLRLLQTMVEVASEKSSTVILPFPVELLRFLEHSSLPHTDQAARNRADAQELRERREAARATQGVAPADAAAGLAAPDAQAAIGPSAAGASGAPPVPGDSTEPIKSSDLVGSTPVIPEVPEIPDVPEVPDVPVEERLQDELEEELGHAPGLEDEPRGDRES